MNGAKGDHPYTDIVGHHLEVFGEGIDDLVRELDALGGFESEIARDWLWIQADNLQEAKDAQDARRLRSFRDGVEQYLDLEIHRIHRAQGRHLDHETHRLHRGQASNPEE
jgi:hypothetical protein